MSKFDTSIFGTLTAHSVKSVTPTFSSETLLNMGTYYTITLAIEDVVGNFGRIKLTFQNSEAKIALALWAALEAYAEGKYEAPEEEVQEAEGDIAAFAQRFAPIGGGAS